jgi:sterol desaturase/sphingolipid hydroxylase (fatty acid hydroxylase superfamily)
VRLDTLAGMSTLFAVLGVVFALLERRWPERTRAVLFSRTRLTDWLYWPFSAFVTGNLTRLFVLGSFGAIALAVGYRGAPRQLLPWLEGEGRFGVGVLPLPVQVFFALAVGDLVNYWNHRLRHTRLLWPFHAVHHSPRTLDWLASVRMHPVDDAVDNVGVGLVVLGMGTSPSVWLMTGPFLFFFNMWLHANVPWRLGPLAYVVATPAFHRWHHAEETAGTPCNFAGVFPAWDLVFGTFHLPAARPASFGPGDAPVPDGLLRQLAFPFVWKSRNLGPAATDGRA